MILFYPEKHNILAEVILYFLLINKVNKEINILITN